MAEVQKTDEIEKLKSLLKRQVESDDPLQFLTGLNLYDRLGYQSLAQHKFDAAKSNYWKSIDYSRKRIRELVSHTKNGFVGGIASSDLIENCKKYIEATIHLVVTCHLACIEPSHLSIPKEVVIVSKEIYKKKLHLDREDTEKHIQIGILLFASRYPSRLVATDNFSFVTTASNFPLLSDEAKAHFMITFYQTLVKEIRKNAHKDTLVARECQSYRFSSAELYKFLGDTQNYYNEMSSSYLYGVYSSKNANEFEENFAKLEKLLQEWEAIKGTSYREPFYKRAYATIYGLDFIDPSDIVNRIRTLKLINYYLSQTKNRARIIYLLYENFYVLTHRINKAKKINHVKLPEQKQFSKLETIDSELQLIKTRYRDLVKFIQSTKGDKTSDNPITDPNIQSALNLYKNGYVDESSLLKLIRKIIRNFMGDKVVPENILDSDRDRDTIESILRLGETSTVEVKRSLSDSGSIGETISAFCNTKGGKIIIGLDEIANVLEYEADMIICKEFVIVGIGNSKNSSSLDDQKKYLALHLDEAGINVSDLIIDSSIRISDKTICVIEVPDLSNVKTTFYKKDAFKRVHAQNLRMRGEELIKRFKNVE